MPSGGRIPQVALLVVTRHSCIRYKGMPSGGRTSQPACCLWLRVVPALGIPLACVPWSSLQGSQGHFAKDDSSRGNRSLIDLVSNV